MLVTFLVSFVMMLGFFLLLYAAIALIQKKYLFTSAPKDIQNAIVDHPERFKRARLLGWILFILALLIMIGSFVYGIYDGVKNDFTYWQFYTRFILIFYLLKLFDIVVFDFVLLTHSQFFQHFYPETKGCEGYHKFGFNWKEHLLYLVITPLLTFLLSYLFLLF